MGTISLVPIAPVEYNVTVNVVEYGNDTQKIENAAVRVNETGATYFTDANGSVTFPLEEGNDYNLTISADGYIGEQHEILALADDTTLDVSLLLTAPAVPDTYAVTFEVYDKDDADNDIRGALIEVYSGADMVATATLR